MSEYGKLWEKVRVIRSKLETLVPESSASVEWRSLADAKAAVEKHLKEVSSLMAQWEAIEKDMEKTE